MEKEVTIVEERERERERERETSDPRCYKTKHTHKVGLLGELE